MPSLSQLRQLDREATPAPWHTEHDPELRNEHGDLKWPAHLNTRFSPLWNFYLNDIDAELVVQVRNGLGSLFAVIDAAREMSTAWDSDKLSIARARLNTALARLEDA